MASNYSAYNLQNNQHPQYVYYTPALARHPNTPPYYYAPAVPVQAVPVGQLHPRSRSFNDLYSGYYPQQQGMAPVPASASPNLSLSSAPAAIPSAEWQAPPAHTRSMSNISATATNQATAAQAPGTPPLPGSGTKPLRYRGRVARSKSHSSLIAPVPNGSLNINVPAGIPIEAPASTGMPSGLSATVQTGGLAPGSQRRRMSSTSSLHRHKTYSPSMSSTDGSSTPSIMSTADTDSLTTQTSVSSTSSVDEEAKTQKFNHARRRSVANSLVDAEKCNENEYEESDKVLATTPEDVAAAVPVLTVDHNTDVVEQSAVSASAAEAEPQAKDSKKLSASANLASLGAVSVGANGQEPSRPIDENLSGTTQPAPAKPAKMLVSGKEDAQAASLTAPEVHPSKAPITRLPIKQNLPQASDASQAREASIKPARSAKQAHPAKGSDSEANQELASEDENIDPKDTSQKLEEPTDDTKQPLRPKRATAAPPTKLVLPSDLQPRSYYQASNSSEVRNSLLVPRQSRSASWYTGSSSPSSPALPTSPEPCSGSSMRPRTPSAESVSSTSSNHVFLRRSYASRQRPDVQSLPARRPESFYAPQQPNAHHPLPMEPTASASQARGAAPSTNTGSAKPHSAKSAHMRSSSQMAAPSAAMPEEPKLRASRSFGSRLKGMFSKEKVSEQTADDSSETASIVSTRSSKSSMSVRSSSSGFSSLSNRFRRKKGSSANQIEIPAPPAPAMTRRTAQVPEPLPESPLSKPMLKTWSGTPSPTEPELPRPPSPALSSVGRQVAPNLTAGDIYPGLLRPNEVDTIISSLERTGSFERKPSTSRRSKEQKVPNEQVIPAPEPVTSSSPTKKPLKSALKTSTAARASSGRTRRIAFAKNTLVYNTYSALDYNRTPEPLPYDLHDRRVVVQLYRELNDLKLSMPVHPSSKHHTQYLFDRDDRHSRAPPQ